MEAVGGFARALRVAVSGMDLGADNAVTVRTARPVMRCSGQPGGIYFAKRPWRRKYATWSAVSRANSMPMWLWASTR